MRLRNTVYWTAVIGLVLSQYAGARADDGVEAVSRPKMIMCVDANVALKRLHEEKYERVMTFSSGAAELPAAVYRNYDSSDEQGVIVVEFVENTACFTASGTLGRDDTIRKSGGI